MYTNNWHTAAFFWQNFQRFQRILSCFSTISTNSQRFSTILTILNDFLWPCAWEKLRYFFAGWFARFEWFVNSAYDLYANDCVPTGWRITKFDFIKIRQHVHTSRQQKVHTQPIGRFFYGLVSRFTDISGLQCHAFLQKINPTKTPRYGKSTVVDRKLFICRMVIIRASARPLSILENFLFYEYSIFSFTMSRCILHFLGDNTTNAIWQTIVH